MSSGIASALLGEAVDYAGLFPPAGVSMAGAVAEYAAARRGPDAWMLGRFVVPAARLEEFAAVRAGADEAAGASLGAPWQLSAIVRDGSAPDRDAVREFNRDAARHGAVVDAIESKPASFEGIDWLAATFEAGYEVYVEVAAGPEAAAWLQRVKARGLNAKVRTGGLTADAFPSPHALAAFLDAAVRIGVPFKATAGLHHAIRGDYRLTYEPDAASAPMYGYLNVLLAAAALGAGHPVDVASRLLTTTDPSALVLAGDVVRWGGTELSIDAIARARTRHLVSFGSCSFREPAAEYHALASPSSSFSTHHAE